MGTVTSFPGRDDGPTVHKFRCKIDAGLHVAGQSGRYVGINNAGLFQSSAGYMMGFIEGEEQAMLCRPIFQRTGARIPL